MKHRPKQIIQTTFLIPIKEDQEVGNGQHHPEKRWEKLKVKQQCIRFEYEGKVEYIGRG